MAFGMLCDADGCENLIRLGSGFENQWIVVVEPRRHFCSKECHLDWAVQNDPIFQRL